MTEKIRKITFTKGQLKLLVGVFSHIAEALFLASIIGPIALTSIKLMNSLTTLIVGLFFLMIALRMEILRERL